MSRFFALSLRVRAFTCHCMRLSVTFVEFWISNGVHCGLSSLSMRGNDVSFNLNWHVIGCSLSLPLSYGETSHTFVCFYYVEKENKKKISIALTLVVNLRLSFVDSVTFIWFSLSSLFVLFDSAAQWIQSNLFVVALSFTLMLAFCVCNRLDVCWAVKTG